MRRTLAAAGRQLTRCHALVEASPAQHRGWDGASAGEWATSRQLRWFGEGWGREMTIHTRDWSFQDASEPRRGLARLGVDAFAASPRVGIRSDGASPASLSRGYAASHSLWVGGNASDRVDATARETDEDADRRSSGDATSASHDGGFTRAPEAERTWVDETLPPSRCLTPSWCDWTDRRGCTCSRGRASGPSHSPRRRGVRRIRTCRRCSARARSCCGAPVAP
jgi:hypothetical protein